MFNYWDQKRTEKTQKITPQNEWCSFEGVQMLSKPSKGALNNTPSRVDFPLFSVLSRYLFPINWGKNTVLIGNALRKYTYKWGKSLICLKKFDERREIVDKRKENGDERVIKIRKQVTPSFR